MSGPRLFHANQQGISDFVLSIPYPNVCLDLEKLVERKQESIDGETGQKFTFTTHDNVSNFELGRVHGAVMLLDIQRKVGANQEDVILLKVTFEGRLHQHAELVAEFTKALSYLREVPINLREQDSYQRKFLSHLAKNEITPESRAGHFSAPGYSTEGNAF